MKDTKSLLKSKTFWGSVITAGAGISAIFGLDIAPAEVTQLVEGIVVFFGLVLTIYGRITAVKTIGKK